MLVVDVHEGVTGEITCQGEVSAEDRSVELWGFIDHGWEEEERGRKRTKEERLKEEGRRKKDEN